VATATVAGDYDRTHVLNAVAAYDLGWQWRVGARFVFFTGQPYSSEPQGYPVPPFNDLRYPPFYRVDVRIEKRWSLGKARSLAFVVEVQNATLSKEGSGLSCRSTSMSGPNAPSNVSTTCTPNEVGPLTIPSLGLEAFF
jgi:hypothetical protein